jgi:hypothetical protein
LACVIIPSRDDLVHTPTVGRRKELVPRTESEIGGIGRSVGGDFVRLAFDLNAGVEAGVVEGRCFQFQIIMIGTQRGWGIQKKRAYIHFLTDLKKTEQQAGRKGGSGHGKIVEACYDIEGKESEIDTE